MSEPTADEIARWAALHVNADGYCWQCERHWPCEPSQLLALVAAQAEQIAELRETIATERKLWGGDIAHGLARVVAVAAERDAARAELHALHATDDYQRWARAVTERDAAREAVGRVRAVCDRADFEHAAFAASLGTGTPPTGEVWVRAVDVTAALDGGAAT